MYLNFNEKFSLGFNDKVSDEGDIKVFVEGEFFTLRLFIFDGLAEPNSSSPWFHVAFSTVL